VRDSSPDPTPFQNAFPEASLEVLGWPQTIAWMASLAQTTPGAFLLESMHPSDESALAQARHARGREAFAAVEADVAPGFGGVGDPIDVLARCEQGLDGPELNAVASTLERLRELRRWAVAHPEYSALSEMLQEVSFPETLLKELRDSLDSRGEVTDDADPGLASARVVIRDLRQKRSQALDVAIEKLSKRGLLRQTQPVRRGARLLLAVKATPQGRGAGVVHDQSQSGDTFFLEPGSVLEVANQLTSAHARERRLVDAVLRRLTAEVLRARDEIGEAIRALAETDVAFTCVTWLREVGGSWPELLPADAPLTFRDARHPLLLQTMERDEIVPLGLELGDAYDLLVVTGPNTGGKTVVLKTVGLLAAMARAGLPVSAADGTRLPMLHGLDADIGDAQSLETSLSTFSGHLTRICRILKSASLGHLVLLDELGTGTDPEEGGALGQAVLEALLTSGARVIANTHLGALKLFSLDLARAENASMEFDPATLSPKYRLLVGVPGASHAVEVAERLGLPTSVLHRAHKLAERGGGADQLLADVGRVRRDAELLREQAAVQEADLRETTKRMEVEEKDSRRRQSLREGESEEAYLDLNRNLESILNAEGVALARSLKDGDADRLNEFLEHLRQLLGTTPLAERKDEFLRTLKKGSLIWVPRYRERMTILKVNRRKSVVLVRHGALEIEIPMREITWVDRPASES